MSVPVFSLAGKLALVTGGRIGIGKAIALAFAEAGADVVVCSRSPESDDLGAVAEEIRRLGRRSLAVQADITRKADIDNLVQRVMGEFGGVDILVNNAGINIRARLIDLQEDDWDRLMDTHLKGYFLCSQAFCRSMIERKKGSIINMASIRAMKPVTPRVAGYSVAKAGVVMLTRVLALELGMYNIRVNAIAPGLIKTEMTEDLRGRPGEFEQVMAQIPLGRQGETSDVVGAALFLASDASSYITGHTLVVDGGQVA